MKRTRMQVDICFVISWCFGRYRKDEYVLVDSVCILPPNCVISENKVANIILPITNWTIKPNARYTSNQKDLKEQIFGMTKVECHMGLLAMVLDFPASQRKQTLYVSLNGL